MLQRAVSASGGGGSDVDGFYHTNSPSSGAYDVTYYEFGTNEFHVENSGWGSASTINLTNVTIDQNQHACTVTSKNGYHLYDMVTFTDYGANGTYTTSALHSDLNRILMVTKIVPTVV